MKVVVVGGVAGGASCYKMVKAKNVSGGMLSLAHNYLLTLEKKNRL